MITWVIEESRTYRIELLCSDIFRSFDSRSSQLRYRKRKNQPRVPSKKGIVSRICKTNVRHNMIENGQFKVRTVSKAKRVARTLIIATFLAMAQPGSASDAAAQSNESIASRTKVIVSTDT